MSAPPAYELELTGTWGSVRLDPAVTHVLFRVEDRLAALPADATGLGPAIAARCEYDVWLLAGGPGLLTHAGEPLTRLLVGGPVDLTVHGLAVHVQVEATAAAPTISAASIGDSDRFAPDVVPSVAGAVPAPPSAMSPVSPTPIAAPDSAVALKVRGLTVATGGHRRLDHIDLDLAAGQFTAVLGTSGAGKSTLLKALTAVEPATSGYVDFAGHDLYTDYDQVCRRIGYVPQDDILHPQLTVVDTLRYAGRLRFPAGTGPETVEQRIDEVLHELGLVGRATARIDQLSGGQRKRVNVAVELLTRPELLILDEPTSGLDPGNERSMMELLRQLADAGRIVLVVTHSVESLHLCDSVLFLASGGVPVYLGPPGGLPAHFAAPDLTSVFVAVEQLHDATSRRVRPQPPEPRPAGRPQPPAVAAGVDNARVAEFGRQFHILTTRYVHVLASDRRNLLILALQAPVLAVLMLAVFGSGEFDASGGVPTKAANALTGMCLGTIYLGASNAVREIVKERVIFRRELTFGVSSASYLASKFAVLGAFTLAQALLLTVTGTLLQRGPKDWLLLAQPRFEMFAVLAVAGLAAVASGLAISAVSSTPDRAMTLLPVLLFAQLLLGGTIFKLGIGINQLSWLMPSRWGITGAGATADLHRLSGCSLVGPGSLDTCTGLWKHQLGNWLLAYFMLLALTAVASYGCWRLLERINPGKALRARAG